tara:strand:+ start:729 stop:1382 length:654 start_codon:yes stop_codon:yes gene_type:complete
MEHYKSVNSSRQSDETNCCSVVALAIAGGIDYDEAYRALENHGRKQGEGAQFYTTIVSAFNQCGISLANCNVEAISDIRTVTSLKGKLAADQVYVILTGNHILTARDGVVQDWSGSRRLRITNVYVATQWRTELEAKKANVIPTGRIQRKQAEIKRPKAGTKTAAVWQACDAFDRSEGWPPESVDDIWALCRELGCLNESTMRVQLTKWKKFRNYAK